MSNKNKKEFEAWFQSVDDSRPVDLLHNSEEKEAIRQNLWQNILYATKGRSNKYLWNSFWVRAVAILFLIGSVILFLYKERQQVIPPSIELVGFSTEKGNLKKILLSDSSEIWLNGGSHIRVPKTFSKLREVYIDDGEVFFQVKKDTSRPFVVHSGRINTKVLGTSFNIKAYRNNPEILISVKTGKVQVTETANEHRTILMPNEQISYSPGENAFRKTIIDGQTINGWTTHKLYYRGVPLSVILSDLEKQYGIKFDTKRADLLSCVYTISFENLPIQAVLAKLQMLGNVQFEINNNHIIIKGKGCL